MSLAAKPKAVAEKVFVHKNVGITKAEGEAVAVLLRTVAHDSDAGVGQASRAAQLALDVQAAPTTAAREAGMNATLAWVAANV
jgi:hypothetical protein